MIKEKDLESAYFQMGKNNMASIILINCMAAPRLNFKMVPVIGGNTRIIRVKDMVQSCGLMDRNTSGNTCKIKDMGMEYSDGQMDRYIMDNGTRIKEKAMEKLYFLTAITIMDSTKMISSGVTECLKKMAKFRKSNTKMANSSAKLKCESCFLNYN
jgi:hypothetical protein